MLPKTPRTVREFIVLHLAKTPARSAGEIHAALEASYGRCTERAVFKELRQLQDDEIVIKMREGYALRLAWAMQLRDFAETVVDSYQRSAAIGALLQEEGRAHSWRFADLRRLDDFWMQVALALFQYTGRSGMCYYTRHTWFHLAHPRKEQQFEEVLRRSGGKLYMIVGTDCYLDRLFAREWPPEVYEHSFAESSVAGANIDSLAAIADYVVTVRLERQVADQLDEFYAAVRSKRDLQLPLIRDLFEGKGRGTLRWERSPAKARRLRQKFSRFFGYSAQQLGE